LERVGTTTVTAYRTQSSASAAPAAAP
jgi:hypothetical protein